MSQLWSDQRIAAEVQQRAGSVANTATGEVLQTLLKELRDEYEQHVAAVKAKLAAMHQWQPVTAAVQISCVDRSHNTIAYIAVQDRDITVTTKHSVYTSSLSDDYRVCKRRLVNR